LSVNNKKNVQTFAVSENMHAKLQVSSFSLSVFELLAFHTPKIYGSHDSGHVTRFPSITHSISQN